MTQPKTPSYICRFQESRLPKNVLNAATGTETVTAVNTERGDSDANRLQYSVIPAAAVPHTSHLASGTKTLTEVKTESVDKDASAEQFDAIPR